MTNCGLKTRNCVSKNEEFSTKNDEFCSREQHCLRVVADHHADVYVLDGVCILYTCRRLIDLSLHFIYMPALDRSLSAFYVRAGA